MVDINKNQGQNDYVLSLEFGGTSIKAYLLQIESDISNVVISSKLVEDSKIMSFKTTSEPQKCVDEICNSILEEIKGGRIVKVGVGCFGPISINKKDSTYGKLLNTPKENWAFFDVLSALSNGLKVAKDDFRIETDVNAAVLLEYFLGNHKVDNIAYITIGTGVGIGLISEGKIIHGLVHTEGGHINVKRHDKDTLEGVCKFHKDCAEGLTTNIALKERKGFKDVFEIESLPDEDTIWDLEAYYIAQICMNLLYLVSIEKIVIGGGIINREILLPKIRDHIISMNNGYYQHDKLTKEKIHLFVQRTEFKNHTGILGGLNLALNN